MCLGRVQTKSLDATGFMLVSEARDSACSIDDCSDTLVTCMTSPGVTAIDNTIDVIYIFIVKSVCVLSLPL